MINIEKGVPVQGSSGSRLSDRNREVFEAMDKMEVGDSFSVPYDKNIAAAVAKRAKMTGRKFSSRKLSDGTMRVWRLPVQDAKPVENSDPF